MTHFFDFISKLESDKAKSILMKTFTKAERIVNSFILQASRPLSYQMMLSR